MRKILIALIGLIMISGCSIIIEEPVELYETPLNSIIDKFEKNESFMFTLGSSNCSVCPQFEETIDKFNSKQDTDILYVNLAKEDNTLARQLIDDYSPESFQGTPTTYFVVNGAIEEIVIGAVDYKTVLDAYNSTLVD